MDREEQVGLVLVGNRGALVQRDKSVIGTGEHDFGAHPLLNQFGEPERDVENNVFFEDTVRSDSPVVVAAVSGVDNDAVHFKTEGSRQGA